MILVTGGTGLVGSHLLLHLVRQGHKVRALKRSNSKIEHVKNVFSCYDISDESFLNQIEWVDGDVCDYFSVNEAMQGISLVFHCAGLVSFNSSEEKSLWEINVNGTTNVVNAALANGIKKLAHVSSVATLDSAINELTDEAHITKNNREKTGYALTKWLAEREVWRANEEGLETVIINPSVIIGPAFWHSGSSMLIHRAKKGIPFYTDISIGIVDVRDVASILYKLMFSEISGERFILNSTNIPVKTVGTILNKIFDYKGSYRHVKKWQVSMLSRLDSLRSLLTGSKPLIGKQMVDTLFVNHAYDNEKIKKLLGFKFIPGEESLEFYGNLYKDYKS